MQQRRTALGTTPRNSCTRGSNPGSNEIMNYPLKLEWRMQFAWPLHLFHQITRTTQSSTADTEDSFLCSISMSISISSNVLLIRVSYFSKTNSLFLLHTTTSGSVSSLATSSSISTSSSSSDCISSTKRRGSTASRPSGLPPGSKNRTRIFPSPYTLSST